ncbi:virulence factor [Carnobacterium iners]|uniref:Virulence factor n=1 Tax=Carnobacterium iners TaxID=1073423 RepID=A0A1X7MRJ7_9LACT|nr:Gfo/Idh/MocA family oxidoreductase [Carnobacterium iners]SEL14789.1 virulence factor [Carnobacterium iners]SMH27325.1 virulence factor [Carnobacterium iners]
MRIGIIGLGDIAQKAYLPVLSEKEGIELILCTRDKEKLERLAKKHRISEYVRTVDELIDLKIDAVLICTPSPTHFELIKKIMENNIHVYIDKPIAMNLAETKQIVQLAKEKKLIAMVGFNRRFAPMIAALKDEGKADMVVIQKNRYILPGDKRNFIVQDFIHVVDTLRFLMDTQVIDLTVQHLEKEDSLYNVVIQLIGKDCTAIGIMNRNNGTTEEIIEYMAEGNKLVVNDLVETTHYLNNKKTTLDFNGWEPTLVKRGFHQIINHFIECVNQNKQPNPSLSDSLITHEICEEIYERVTK